MSENKLVGSLVLRTFDIDQSRATPTTLVLIVPTPFDGDYGTMTANGKVVTWKNVNIRTCLGELYRKYDRFNLKLTAVRMRHTGVAITDAQVMIFMNGLPFSSGSCYSTILGPINQCALGCVNFVLSTTAGATSGLVSGTVYF